MENYKMVQHHRAFDEADIPTIASKDDRLLAHIVWLPTVETQRDAAALSKTLNEKTYTQSYYELMSGMESPDRPGLTCTFQERADLLKGRYSLPHITLMHFWARPEEAASIFCQLKDELKIRNLVGNKGMQANVRSLEIFSEVARWQGQPDEKDYVAWINASREGPLREANRLASEIVEKAGLTTITPTGDKYFPHITLACEPREWSQNNNIVLTKGLPPPAGVKNGEIVLGVSGPNGQFRGPIASMEEDSQPSKDQILRRFHDALTIAL
jgi:hypothetical protein